MFLRTNLPHYSGMRLATNCHESLKTYISHFVAGSNMNGWNVGKLSVISMYGPKAHTFHQYSMRSKYNQTFKLKMCNITFTTRQSGTYSFVTTFTQE